MTFSNPKARSGICSLTDEQVVWLREEYRNGRNTYELADALGMSRETTRAAIRGHSYRHVPGAVPSDFKPPRRPVERIKAEPHVSPEAQIHAAFLQWQGGEPRQDWRVRL